MGSLMYTRRDCRLCGSRNLQLLFSLGSTPLANEFVSIEDISRQQRLFPLDVHICNNCGHVQLLHVVDPEILFRNYVYVSSTSPVFVEHFRRYSEDMLDLTGIPQGSLIVEIGSNDGTMLRFFKDAGMRVLGVDPARAIAAEATKSDIPTLPEFFDFTLAQRIRREHGAAFLVVANNVFAHADDLHTIVDGVAHLLDSNGIFVFEVSYLLDVFEKTLFDTIYHEHLSYHTVKPLVGLFDRHSMELVDVIRVDTHGGSLRGIVKLKGGNLPRKASVEELIALEASLGLHDADAYFKLFNDIQRLKADLWGLLDRLHAEGKKIVGFGAAAKATTLMFHFGIGPDIINCIIDDSPLKQGLYSPGHHIPIVPSYYLYDESHRPDYALILAWNFAESIMAKHQAFMDGGGHFIVPLPYVYIR